MNITITYAPVAYRRTAFVMGATVEYVSHGQRVRLAFFQSDPATGPTREAAAAAAKKNLAPKIATYLDLLSALACDRAEELKPRKELESA